MDEPRSHQVLTAVGVGSAALGLAFAVLSLVVIQQNTDDRPADVLAATLGALAMIVGLGLALAGLIVVRRDPTIGRQLAIVGGVVIVAATLFVFSWAWPIGIVLALPSLIGVVRARQVVEVKQQQPA